MVIYFILSVLPHGGLLFAPLAFQMHTHNCQIVCVCLRTMCNTWGSFLMEHLANPEISGFTTDCIQICFQFWGVCIVWVFFLP